MKTSMKFVFAFAMLFCFATSTTFAQKTVKQLNKELKAKADKTAIKEAKVLAKEGWKTMAGTLSLDKQIDAAKKASIQTDGDGEPMYYMASFRSVGGNYSAAKQIASNRAKTDLVRSSVIDIADKTMDTMASSDLGDGDLELIDETVTATKFTSAMTLKGTTQFLEIYKQLPNNKFEVMITLGIERKTVEKEFKAKLRADLRDKSAKLAAELDKE